MTSMHEKPIAAAAPPTATLRRLWWLHPAWPFGCVLGVTILAAWAQNDNAYRLYGAPKYVQFDQVLMAFAAIAVFTLGCHLARVVGATPRSEPRSADALIRKFFYLFTALTLLGYAAWFAVGIKNGFSPRMAVELFTGDEDQLLRKEIFPTIPGVTTCTQFGVAAILLGAWLLARGERKRLLAPMVALYGAAGVRCLLFSERLALIELIVPLLIVGLRAQVLGRPIKPLLRGLLFAAPVVGGIGFVAFFGFCEYFRSWKYYQNSFDSYSEFTVWRLSGYYTTAHNNAAIALTTHQPRPLPYYNFRALWEFPGIRTSSFSYQALTGVDVPKQYDAMLERYGTPELNSEGGFFQPALEFGVGGFLLYWFGYGFVACRFYRQFLAGALGGVVFYPLIYISLLQAPLLLFLSATRTFPSLVALLFVIWWISRATGSAAMGSAASGRAASDSLRPVALT